MDENVGLKVDAAGPYAPTAPEGGLANLAPKELDAAVEPSAPVAPSEPPGFSFSCLFK